MNTGKTYLSLRKQWHSFPPLNNSSQKIKKLILEGISKFIVNCHIQCTAGKKKKALHWLKYISRWAPMFSIFSYARESSGFLDQDLLMLWTTISLACQETQALLENIHLHHQMSSSAYLYNIYASWILSK